MTTVNFHCIILSGSNEGAWMTSHIACIEMRNAQKMSENLKVRELWKCRHRWVDDKILKAEGCVWTRFIWHGIGYSGGPFKFNERWGVVCDQ